MLQDLMSRTRVTGSRGMHRRFAQSFDDWVLIQVAQSKQRTVTKLPTLERYLIDRRRAFGIGLFCAITEFSVDIDLPDFIFKGPAVREMTEALFDMTVWANDLCSFNKEQAQGDY
ncbi:isoprenoid synthase domain-containing protein [Pterulicium gracile]|uniref:Terpene synthase n=1 Tax=Pterulicium gracile TaxID=1884261 RepID=A0A5C3Q539_9AGAR|nr:isoprenoid synthase domain-containing protein [Pterula gracilis]